MDEVPRACVGWGFSEGGPDGRPVWGEPQQGRFRRLELTESGSLCRLGKDKNRVKTARTRMARVREFLKWHRNNSKCMALGAADSRDGPGLKLSHLGLCM